ncbi:MAG: hypothetical protein CMO01_23345 [Thalassobius sp.]|nr:hypothetical protein [Thalassovita sp.]
MIYLLYILSFYGYFSLQPSTTLNDEDEIRIQLSVFHINQKYTLGEHHIYKLQKNDAGYKGYYYFSQHADEPARFKRRLDFTETEIIQLYELVEKAEKIYLEVEPLIYNWDIQNYGYINITTQSNIKQTSIYDKEILLKITSLLHTNY